MTMTTRMDMATIIMSMIIIAMITGTAIRMTLMIMVTIITTMITATIMITAMAAMRMRTAARIITNTAPAPTINTITARCRKRSA